MKPGDKVTWTRTRLSGRSLSMQVKEGTVQSIGFDNIAMVKVGRRVWPVHTSRLRPAGEKTQLTEFVEAVRENARKADHA